MSLALLSSDPMFGLPYARASYLVIFGALFGYGAWLHLSQRVLRRRLEEAERRLGTSPNEGR